MHEGFDISGVPKIIISALPNLIWSAVVINNKIHLFTNYRTPAHELQGQTETAILQLQKTLPDMPNLIHIPVKKRMGLICHIYASNPAPLPVTKTDKEFLLGTKRIIQLLQEHEELNKEESLLQEAEIRALQAQINPHFLYNTLNAISFYVRSNPDTARKLIKYLSDYFRHTLNNPSKLISLSSEIYDITCYMELERARFQDRLQIEFRIPKDKENKIKIPPLLLQPLVENAVIHGILKKEEGGKIIVGLNEHKKFYRIYVSDTGIGIPSDKLKKLLVNHQRRNHIGLINVHQRLTSMFGEHCMLHILSKLNKGTIVYIDIPKENESDHEIKREEETYIGD